MKKLLGILFVLFLLVLTASPQAVLRGRLTTNEAAWQESPLLPGLTATNLTVASNLTVRGSVLNPLLPGTNVTFTTNAGVVSVHAQGGLKATNANQFGTGEVLTVKSGALLTNLTVYGDGTNALVLSSGVLTSSAPAIDISQTWSNSGVTFSALRVNTDGTNIGTTSRLLELQRGGIPIFYVSTNGNAVVGHVNQSFGTAPGSAVVLNGTTPVYLSADTYSQGNFVLRQGSTDLLMIGGNMNPKGLVLVRSGDVLSFGNYPSSPDTHVGRESIGVVQLGIDAATATAQTIKSHDGSGTDKSGADFRLAAGQGTGTGAGGALNLATAAAGSASTNTLNAYSNRVSISPNGAVTINPPTTNATLLTLNSGVLTNSAPALDIFQTWSNGGVSFTGLNINVADSNSSSSSYLLDAKLGANVQFRVTKFGLVYATKYGYTDGAGTLVPGSYYGGFSTDRLQMYANSQRIGQGWAGVGWNFNGRIGLSAANSDAVGADTFMARDAAAVFQLGADADTPIAQTLKAHDGSGTDKNGSDLRIAAGQGTGVAAGGTLSLATASAGASSTNTLNAYSNRVSISPNGAVTINQPSASNITLLAVNPVATSTGILVKAAASQSADLLRIENSSGSKQFSLRSDGAVDYGDNSVISYVGGTAAVRWGGGVQSFGGGAALSAVNNPSSPLVYLYPESAAVLQLGADAASPVSQTVKGPDGSGTNVSGANLSLAAGQGTGTAAGGSLSLATASAGASSTNTLNSYSNRLTIDANGTVTINPTSTNAPELVINSGVITSSAPALDISQTWSNSATTFTGLKLNVTDSNSSATSSLLDVQLGGSNRFRIDKWGSAIFLNTNGIRSDGPNYAHLKLGNGFNVGSGFMFSGYNAPHSPFLNMYMESSGEWTARMVNSGSFSWTDNPSIATSGTRDLILQRDSAATLQLGADAATPIAQTLKSHDGSGTDKNGADLTVAAGRGTGTGPGGSLVLRTAAAGSASTNTLNTASNRLVIDPNGAVTLNPTTTNAPLLTLNSGVITNSAPALSISQTWSNSATTFTALKVDVVNSNAAGASRLFQLTQNGQTKLGIKSSVQSTDLEAETGNAVRLSQYYVGINGGGGGPEAFRVGNTLVTVGGVPFALGPSVTGGDTYLTRDAAATLQLGLDAATVTDQTLKAHDGSGTDKDGATIAVAGGQGTGAAKGGSVVLRTAPAGGSGSSKNSYGDRNFVYSGRTTLGVNAAYDLFEVNLPDGEMVGLEVFVTTFSVGSSSTDLIVNTDNFNVSAYSYGTAVYSSVSTNNISTTKSSGFDTVTTSFDVLDLNQNAFRVRVTPTFGTSTSGVTVTAVWQVRVNSTVPATVTPL